MNRSFRLLAVLVLALALLPVNAFAATQIDQSENVIYFDDGSYMTVELSEISARAMFTTSGSKTCTFHASDGESLWKVVLNGTFTYTGAAAACTEASCNVTIYDSAWSVESKTSETSSNSAVAEVTIIKKLLGITVDRETVSLKLTCSVDGTLS